MSDKPNADARRCSSTLARDTGGTLPTIIQCDRYEGHEGDHSAPMYARYVWRENAPSSPASPAREGTED